jgi:DNA-binding LytR/AlgR family response regulator
MTGAKRRDIVRGLFVAAAAALLLALSGAFGTGDYPFYQRLVYWSGVMGAGWIWGETSQPWLARRVDADERPWLLIFLLTGLVAIPMSLFVWAATGLFFDGILFPLSRLPFLLVPVVSVTLAICILIVFLGRATPVQTHAAADPAQPARFIERLPRRLRAARLIAVQAEDHYLRVHTDIGSDLILMRLSDAIRETDGLDGLQIHRSHWVAREAVADQFRDKDRLFLRMSDGAELPVSRNRLQEVRQAGLV